MKKKILIFSLFIVLFCVVGFFFKSFHIKESTYCSFCDRKIIDYQKYFEDEDVIGLYSHRPLLKGHCLILPKRHIERFENLTEKELLKINQLINKTHSAVQKIIDVKSYMILQKNGKEVGQTVPHLHFHYIPNKKNGSNFSFLLRFLFYPFKLKINENQMHEMTGAISENF